jgi:hypothetical protein
MHMHALHGGKILCNKAAPSNYTTEKHPPDALQAFWKDPLSKERPYLPMS